MTRRRKTTKRKANPAPPAALPPPPIVNDASGVYVRVPPELVGLVCELIEGYGAGARRVIAENPTLARLALDLLAGVKRR